MSKPRSLDLPSRTRAYRLGTPRQEFAVLDSRPERRVRGTVLLVPGYTGSKEDFLALLDPLADAGYRAVAVDGRGQFESPGPRRASGYTPRVLGADVIAQAAALGDGPVHLVGHSFGGFVARSAARLDPSAFRSLTLLSSGPGRVAPDQRTKLRMLRAALPVLPPSWVWAVTRWLDGRDPAYVADPPEIVSFLERRWFSTQPAQLIATGRQLRVEPDRTEGLAGLPLPLHVAYGDGETVWTVGELAHMARSAGARHTVIAGADHSPNVSHPAELTAALTEFWTS
ncbi:alpha/beta fold hydrolase [Streptomyces xanthochromogenes]|uniref:Alpha/beta hydrolase n=1 Tax=Streptomyces xanthochromogenes TaxID=67384 RepID=A0ABQ3A446_9ACTN|nr:alpha/beta hydrolase [Streptomyces xanthochromogenes]GGY34682.1 alpha/beta hydrolase [Streptomyces xanthochromogenes]